MQNECEIIFQVSGGVSASSEMSTGRVTSDDTPGTAAASPEVTAAASPEVFENQLNETPAIML